MSHNSKQNTQSHNHPFFTGPIGGAITKNLVELGEKELLNSTNTNNKKRGKNL